LTLCFSGGDEILSDETGGYVARMGNMEWETALDKCSTGRTDDGDTEENVCVCVCEMPFVLYGCEACSVTLMEEPMLSF
jgi:hypothetical protein